jgi:hypothetical protein
MKPRPTPDKDKYIRQLNHKIKMQDKALKRYFKELQVLRNEHAEMVRALKSVRTALEKERDKKENEGRNI